MGFDRKAYSRNYRQKHREYYQAYYKTEHGKKSRVISQWKRNGLIETKQYTYSNLYDAYLYHDTCENCSIQLTVDARNTHTTKCMDHDHTTGIFRDILCMVCNIKRG